MATVTSKKDGFGLVEVMITASIMVVAISALVSTASYFLKTSYQNAPNLQAGYLLEEGAEALKLIRDNGWTSNIATLSNNTPYYLYWTGTTWTATTSTSTIDSIFYRTITLGAAYRDGNYDLANSGTLDTNTRKATVTVAWFDQSKAATTSRFLLMYITNVFEN